MFRSRRSKVLGGIALAAALASGAAYSVINHTDWLWKKPKPEYLVEYQEALDSRGTRLFDWMRTFDKNPSRKKSLADRIADYGYVPISANVPSLNGAELIIFGDFHRQMDRKLNLLLPELMEKSDHLLIEQSTDTFTPLDLRVYSLSDIPEHSIPHPPPRNFDEVWKYALEAIEGIQKIEKRERVMKWGSPQNNFYLEFLAGFGKGRVFPIDAKSEIKYQRLTNTVELVVLRSAYAHHLVGIAYHPFEAWMLTDNLGICTVDAPAKEVKDAIDAYFRTLPSLEEIDYQRQSEISDNIVAQVDKLNPKEKAVLVIGDAHLEGHEPNLFHTLQRERIGYVAFSPDEKLLFRGSEESQGNALVDKEAMRRANYTYIQEGLFPNYVDIRVERGGSRFIGSFEGMVDRMMKTPELLGKVKAN